MTLFKSAIYLYFKLPSKLCLNFNIVTPGEPSFKIGKGRPVRVTFLSLSTAFIQLYEGLKMGMISALTRFFRKVPKGKMAKEGRKRGGKAEKEKDAEGIGMSELSLINRALPPELLEKIFGYLAPKDLNNVMLVCKTWNTIGESPGLWSKFKITKNSQLSSKRLQVCQEIIVGHSWNGARNRGGDFNLGEISRNILQRPAVKKICLSFWSAWEHMRRLDDDWFRNEGHLLIEAIAKVEELVIKGTISGNRDNKGSLHVRKVQFF